MQSQIDPRWLKPAWVDLHLRWHWQAGRGPQPEASGRTLRTVEKKRTLVIDTLHVWRNIFEFWHGTTWPTFRSAARQQIKIKLCFIFQQFQRICSTQRIQTATNFLQFPFFILKVKGHKISNQNVGIGVPDRESVGNWDQHPHGSLVKSCKDTIQPLRIAVSFVCGMACSSVSAVLNNVRKTSQVVQDRWDAGACHATNERHGDSERLYRDWNRQVDTKRHSVGQTTRPMEQCIMCWSSSPGFIGLRRTGHQENSSPQQTLQRRRCGSCSRTVVENDEPKRRMLLWPSHETFHRLPPEGIWGVPEGQGGEGQGPNQPQESEDRQWVKASTKSCAGRMIKDGDQFTSDLMLLFGLRNEQRSMSPDDWITVVQILAINLVPCLPLQPLLHCLVGHSGSLAFIDWASMGKIAFVQIRKNVQHWQMVGKSAFLSRWTVVGASSVFDPLDSLDHGFVQAEPGRGCRKSLFVSGLCHPD